MATIDDVPDDILEKIFNIMKGQHDSSKITPRTITRFIEQRSLLFVSKKFNQLSFGLIRKVYLDRRDNKFLSSWNKVVLLIHRFKDTIQQLSLVNFDMKLRSTRGLNRIFDKDGHYGLPALEALKLEKCDPLVTKVFLCGINGEKLQKLYLDVDNSSSTCDRTRKFFAGELLRYLDVRFPALRHIELQNLFFNTEITKFDFDNLLNSLETLKINNVKRVDLWQPELLRIFQEYRKLRTLSIQVEHILPSYLVELCISVKNTIEELYLDTHSDAKVSNNNSLTDTDAIVIIDECGKLRKIQLIGNDDFNAHDQLSFHEHTPNRNHLTSFWVLYAVQKLGRQLIHIGMNYLLIQPPSLTRIATTCTDLKSLSLANCRLNKVGLAEFLDFFQNRGPKLEELDLHGLEKVTDDHLLILENTLCRGSLRCLNASMLSTFCSATSFYNFIKRSGSNLERLHIYGSSSSLHGSLPFLDMIDHVCNKKKLSKLVIELPDQVGRTMDALSKIRALSNQYPELLVRYGNRFESDFGCLSSYW